jgi:hypothetical protein
MEIKQIFVLVYRKYVDLSLIKQLVIITIGISKFVGGCQPGFDFNAVIRCNGLPNIKVFGSM